MLRRLSAVASLILGASIMAPQAQAQNFTSCGGNAFWSCVTLATTGPGTGTGQATLIFNVTNVSNGSPANNPSSVFKFFGIGSSGTAPIGIGSSSTNFTTLCSVAISGCDKSNANPSSYSGMGFTENNIFGLNAIPPAPTNGLTDGQHDSFFLTFTDVTAANSFLRNAQFALHDIGGLTNACGSNKAAFSIGGTPLAGSASPTANTDTCNPGSDTVPEPSSIALLGTGLIGIVPIMRRRRK